MTCKIKFISIFILFLSININAQVTPITGDYKVIDLGWNGTGDYTKNLILLHEIYNDILIGMNNAVGTITAFRGNEGAGNRINIVEINSSSAYNGTYATIKSTDGFADWTLKTCTYNGKKYLALDVPYSAAYHSNGYKFAGWTTSTAENMKSINYEVNGLPVNTNILSNIQNYTPNMNETHQVNNFLIMGNNVGIGTMAPDEKLTVRGKIHTQEVRVDMAGPLVPDYVFANDYKLKSLQEVEDFIKENKHLPEVPSAQEIEKNGLMLAEMNIKLLQKIEELTLYMIELKKENDVIKKENKEIKKDILNLKSK
ncbi:tail fiber protein [Flavobacterium chilense]|uniref:Listeria/Bacterioides repeat-containing protein n=1 Tax=Flavobacterium chilense TaxID=946677 RepID=A0A1M7N102_9FLAO|nr:tail fiber protein [Flavobacterium chilense]SHM97010.1 hypothetical protein SAMN05444484_11714 [Flavobacterium chilense]